MRKRIVVLADGTWQTAFEGKGDGPSNIARLSALIPPQGDVPQYVFYDAGVGTEGGVIAALHGGVTGWGLELNIKQCYRFIATHYEPGDELFFFGFSRGAYTVRSLAGMIRKAGILRREHLNRVDGAMALYRNADAPSADGPTRYRLAYSHAGTPEHPDWPAEIKFLGVFDTVGAMGIYPALGFDLIGKRHQFHDTELSKIVRTACHALARDERRMQFKAVLWKALPPEIRVKKDEQVVEQVWFAGCHADIGGGTRHNMLADITLNWMAGRAQDCGLAMDAKMLAALNPDPLAQVNESRTGFYRLFGERWRAPNPTDRSQRLHPSVRTRLTHDWPTGEEWRPESLREIKGW